MENNFNKEDFYMNGYKDGLKAAITILNDLKNGCTVKVDCSYEARKANFFLKENY